MKTPTIDELFKIFTIDRKRNRKISIGLTASDGTEVDLQELAAKMTEFVEDKMSAEDDNNCRQKIFPLMAQVMGYGMVKLFKKDAAIHLLSNEHFRYSITYMMSVAFFLLKFLQKEGVKITTFEESITSEEVDMYNRISQATDLIVRGSDIGLDHKTMIEELIKAGKLKKEDLEGYGYEPQESNGELN